MLRVILGIALGFVAGYFYGSERARDETRRLFASAPEPVRQATGRVSDAIASAPVPETLKQAATRATATVQTGTERAAQAVASTADASQPSQSEVVSDLVDWLPRADSEASTA